MNFDDKIILIGFISRPGMFITKLDKDNVINFLTGYEMGSSTCNLTEPLELYISQTFNYQLNSSRWIGQVDLLSKKLSFSWVVTFRRTALHLIVDNDKANFLTELNTTLKTKLISLTKQIVESGNPFFNKSWFDEWLSLCVIKSDWFSQMWSEKELKIIKAIDTKVRRNKLFIDNDKFLPTPELLKLRLKLDQLKIENGI